MTINRAFFDEGKRFKFSSPYHPDFPSLASSAGGRWNGDSKTWSFDARDEERVKKICLSVYGEAWSDAGAAPVELVTVRVTLTESDSGKSLFAFGRCLAERRWRDSRVSLGAGVVVADDSPNDFGGSGGSAKNPRLGDVEGIVLEVRDVPAGLLDAARAKFGDRLTVVCAAVSA